MSRAIWITGRPDSGSTTPAAHEESLRPTLRLHTHAPDFRSVEDVLLLARRPHRAAAATVTQAERNVP